MTVEVVNFGCRLNIAEGEAIRLSAIDDGGDLIIFNTCAVTAEAERQARQAIRKAAKSRPEARIYVTGCAAEVSGSTFLKMAEVAGVVPNAGKRIASAYASTSAFLSLSKDRPSSSLGTAKKGSPSTGSGGAVLAMPAVSGADHARAFVEVQNGCDHDCTFCVTTLARGNSRSIPAGGVIEAIQKAVARGHREVVLTGVDLTSYGGDLPGAPSLGLLVERILSKVPALERLRLSSLDCIEVDDRLFDLIVGEKRIMPHLHLSLQSGDDMILKRMKRRHSRAEAVALVERIQSRRPELSIGADLIAGFPTETEEMFAGSLALIADCTIVHPHIFPYSPRPGTAAARMPQLDRALIRERAARLRAVAGTARANWLASMVGSRQRVLVEMNGRTGHAESFAPVRLAGAHAPKSIVDVTITGTSADGLIAA